MVQDPQRERRTGHRPPGKRGWSLLTAAGIIAVSVVVAAAAWMFTTGAIADEGEGSTEAGISVESEEPFQAAPAPVLR